MSNKEIAGITLFINSIKKVKGIIDIAINYTAFGSKPTVHVTHDFFVEHFKDYPKQTKDFIDGLKSLFTEIDGVVWFCLIEKGEEECLLTEQK